MYEILQIAREQKFDKAWTLFRITKDLTLYKMQRNEIIEMGKQEFRVILARFYR